MSQYQRKSYTKKPSRFRRPVSTPEAFYEKHAHYTSTTNPIEIYKQKHAVDQTLEDIILTLPDNVLANNEWKNQYKHLRAKYEEICSIGRNNFGFWKEQCSVPHPSYLRLIPSKKGHVVTNSIFVNACRSFFTYTKFMLYHSKDMSVDMLHFKQTFQKHLELKEWLRHVVTAYNKQHPDNKYRSPKRVKDHDQSAHRG